MKLHADDGLADMTLTEVGSRPEQHRAYELAKGVRVLLEDFEELDDAVRETLPADSRCSMKPSAARELNARLG